MGGKAIMLKLPDFLTVIAVVFSLIFIHSTFSCTEGVSSRDMAREAEVKSNLHTIQIALERYATDHGGQYPVYILGGDTRGWDPSTGCRALTEPEADKTPPEDPLIKDSYMSAYPTNPFTDTVPEVISATGSCELQGCGDVRFGFKGEIMGNCLDDPRYLFLAEGMVSNLQYTMLPDEEMGIGVIRSGKPNSFYCMGGTAEGNSWWPGQFFYRSAGDYFIGPGMVNRDEYEDIWGWPYMRINKYMLGAYGPLSTEGMDVIRLTTKGNVTAAGQPGAEVGIINNQYYQDNMDPESESSHPDFNLRIKYSNPEVYGGGEMGLMPQFPYYGPPINAWMFGAPDGFRDGVILVLTSGSDSEKFTEWQG